MSVASRPVRTLGTMVAYGFPNLPLTVDLALARRMGASVVEILPDWPSHPNPHDCRRQVNDAGLVIHSVHGSWGGHSISCRRVDLAQTSEPQRQLAVDDLKQCIDWIHAVGGRCLVLHPGGLSDREEIDARREALQRSLGALAEHVGPSDLLLCVENMPPGVYPGSRMSDLTALVAEINHPSLALVLDTGHARLSNSPEAETLAAGSFLRSLHVHDNDGRSDTHLPPGSGSIDWMRWLDALDEVGYTGPIVLECIRKIRHDPTLLSRPFLTLLADLTRDPAVLYRRDSAPA